MLSHHELADLQRHGERLVVLDQFPRCQRPDETGEETFGKADEGVTVNTAVVLQAFVGANRHFG